MIAKLFLALGLFVAASPGWAQEVYWKEKQVVYKIKPGDAGVSTYSDVFERVLRTRHPYECGYYVEPEVIVREGTCYKVRCDGSASSSRLWDDFFTAPKKERAKKLAEAIKGVGQKSAEALLEEGYFQRKPRTWDAFETEIEGAARAGVITPQVRSLVLSTYREDNMANLGLSRGTCRQEPYACQEVIVVREGYYQPRTCEEVRESTIETRAMTFLFSNRNAELLPQEIDEVKFRVSGDLSGIRMEQGIYNKYGFEVTRADASSVSLLVTGVQRNRVNLPARSLRSAQLVPRDVKNASLQVSVDAGALPVDGGEKLVLTYTVNSCRVGLLGACGFSWDRKDTYSVVIDKTENFIEVPVLLTPGRKGINMQIDLSLVKQNSRFHNERAVETRTEKIRIR